MVGKCFKLNLDALKGVHISTPNLQALRGPGIVLTENPFATLLHLLINIYCTWCEMDEWKKK